MIVITMMRSSVGEWSADGSQFYGFRLIVWVPRWTPQANSNDRYSVVLAAQEQWPFINRGVLHLYFSLFFFSFLPSLLLPHPCFFLLYLPQAFNQTTWNQRNEQCKWKVYYCTEQRMWGPPVYWYLPIWLISTSMLLTRIWNWKWNGIAPQCPPYGADLELGWSATLLQ